MPQSSQITTRNHVDSWHSLPRIVLGSRQAQPATVGGAKKNLTKCGKRQLQFFTVSPMRPHLCETSFNAAFIRQVPFNVPSKVKHLDYITISTCSSTFHDFPISSCRKSHSMIDLSTVRYNLEDNSNSGFQTGLEFARLGQIAIRTMNLSSLTINPRHSLLNNQVIKENEEKLQEILKKAANLVRHALMLNAWRHRREEVGELHEIIRQLIQQTDHLQLQTVVLRRLLDTGNNRVGQLSAEIYRVRTQLENTTKEKTGLTVKNQILENENNKLKTVSEGQVVTLENWKNELLSTKSQFKDVEAQIKRDHEKLLKLRDDKKFLLEKVSTNEILAAECNDRAERAEVIVKELQGKIEIQMGIINRLQVHNNELWRELRDTQAEKNRLNDHILVIDNTEKALSLHTANITIQLNDREAALRRIEAAYNTQLLELNDFRRQSHEMGWTRRVLQIAGSVARAPRAILRTISSLSSTSIISYRQE